MLRAGSKLLVLASSNWQPATSSSMDLDEESTEEFKASLTSVPMAVASSTVVEAAVDLAGLPASLITPACLSCCVAVADAVRSFKEEHHKM